MKKAVVILLIVLLTSTMCVCLSACTTKADLIVWWPSGKDYRVIIEDVLSRFGQLYPDVSIKVVYKDIDAFDAYKMALSDDKTRPDVAILDHVYVQALAQNNQLADLTVSTSDIKSQFPEALYSANMYDSKVYALPMSANTVVLMTNNDILIKCGITDSDGNAKIPDTFEDLLQACKTVQSKGYIAFAQPINSFAAMGFSSYVSRNGGQMISDDGRTVTLDNIGVTKALENWKQLSAFCNTNAFEEDKFYNNKVAFCEMGSWSLPKVTGSSALFDCGFSEMVTINSVYNNFSGLGLYSLCVAKKSSNTEVATALAKFLSTDKSVQLAFNKAKNLFAVTNEALSDEYYTKNDAYKVFAAQLQKVTPRPATPVWPDMEQAIINLLHEVVASDGTDFSAIVQKYQTQVQAVVDRLYK